MAGAFDQRVDGDDHGIRLGRFLNVPQQIVSVCLPLFKSLMEKTKAFGRKSVRYMVERVNETGEIRCDTRQRFGGESVRYKTAIRWRTGKKES